MPSQTKKPHLANRWINVQTRLSGFRKRDMSGCKVIKRDGSQKHRKKIQTAMLDSDRIVDQLKKHLKKKKSEKACLKTDTSARDKSTPHGHL